MPNSDHSAKKRAVIHRGVNQRAHADVLCCGVVTVLGVVDVAIGCHRRVCTQRALTLDLECERVGVKRNICKNIYIYGRVTGGGWQCKRGQRLSHSGGFQGVPAHRVNNRKQQKTTQHTQWHKKRTINWRITVLPRMTMRAK